MAQPWITLASVPTKEGALDLRRRGEHDFLITIQGRVLMSSRAHRSEDALAKLGCAGLRQKAKARVLVSGLGMGFTLRSALDELSPDAKVVVAELNPIVATWCEKELGALTNHAANDPRVSVKIVDVAKYISGVAATPTAARFDSIVLDMYEGPQTRVKPQDPLYGPAAIGRTRKALSREGVLAVWCEGPSIGFEQSLRNSNFRFSLERVGKGTRTYYVYLAYVGSAPRVNKR